MRFGATRDAARRARARSAAGLALFARAPVDAQLRAPTCCPSMVLLGIGAGLAFPSLMTLAMSGATPERRRAGLGPGQHHPPGRRRDRTGGARDAVEHAPSILLRQGTRASALTSGYHLAFLIGAVLVRVGLVVGVFVLRSGPRIAEDAVAEEEPTFSEAVVLEEAA